MQSVKFHKIPQMQYLTENLMEVATHFRPEDIMNIQLGVICTQMVDFCRSSHIIIYLQIQQN